MYSCLELTSRSRVLFEKLSGSQLVKKFPAFYGTRRLITAFKCRSLAPIMSQINPVHVPTSHLWLFKKLITFEYYRHLLLHGWAIAIDNYRLLPFNVDYCRLLPSYATPPLVFLVSFFILRADEALMSSITVLPSGSAVSYSVFGSLSCNPVSVIHLCFIRMWTGGGELYLGLLDRFWLNLALCVP